MLLTGLNPIPAFLAWRCRKSVNVELRIAGWYCGYGGMKEGDSNDGGEELHCDDFEDFALNSGRLVCYGK